MKTFWPSLAVLGLLVAPGLARASAEKSDTERLQRQIDELHKELDEIRKSGPQRTEATPEVLVPQTLSAPFSNADYTWLNGNSRVDKPLIDNDWFTSQFMADVNYTYDFNHPTDHTIDGACEVGRHNEIQLQQLGLGGDLH